MTNTTRTLLFAGALFLSAAVGTAADRSTDTLPGYLETWKRDRAARGVIEDPSACTASMQQLLIAALPSCTVQAPQLPVSQPMWVPVRSRSSRRKCTSSSDAGTSRS